MNPAATAMQAADRAILVLARTPGCSHTAASAAKPQIVASTPNKRPAERSPCSNGRSVCVSDNWDIHPSTPGCPASAKSSTQEPMVKARVMIAAVAALSEMLAEKSAMVPTKRP